ncbi:small subunit of terminase [Enterococcus faecalis]|uniref:phage terminase small subunit n=1 Tax=Enterococcus faecalis TaxID=1351 RepID=UPI001C63BD70|nr:phage terminase small subunit [Enterococcus faecalis]MBW7792082.1 small subunit of terminase [Enterococcus faecalis]
MARKRDPRRDEAKKIWLDSGGKKVLKELASELNVSDSQIRKWKSVDKWAEELKGNVTKSNSNVTNKSGAPPGNKNAKGNKGGSPPKGNKNAIKTGEYETIFADMLSDEEKDIYSNLNDEIRLLKVRQFRMMKRIKEAEKGLNDEEVERLQQLRKIKTPVEKDGRKLEIKREVMQDVQVTRKTFRKLDDILAIEDALTRISNQLTKAVKQQNALLANDAKLQLLKVQTEKAKASLGATSGDMDMPVFIDDISGDGYD